MRRFERFRRTVRRVWLHRWPQFCWWTGFVLGLPAIRRCRQRFAWVRDLPGGIALPVDCAPPGCHVAPGAVHVHTTYSDGLGSVSEVAAAAARAGLDFVVITDHDTLQSLADGWEGYRAGCLVLIGAEARVRGGHILALNVPHELEFGIIPIEQAVERASAAGGMSFFLPDEDLSLSPGQVRRLPFAGMEVINLHNLARQVASLPWLLVFAWRYVTRGPMAALGLLAARPDGDLAIWDQLGRDRPLPGIASVDAHSRMYLLPRRDIRIPTYEQSFRLVQTHLLLDAPLTGDPARDRVTVYAALAGGRAHLVYGDSEPARGIRFWAAGSGGRANVGAPIDDQPDLCLYASSPEPRTLFRLYRDGRMLAQQTGRMATFPAPEPGAYRLEVYRWRRQIGPLCLGVDPWLFTNCIRVLPRRSGRPSGAVTGANRNPGSEGSA